MKCPIWIVDNASELVFQLSMKWFHHAVCFRVVCKRVNLVDTKGLAKNMLSTLDYCDSFLDLKDSGNFWVARLVTRVRQ